jgi:hypothetical protein
MTHDWLRERRAHYAAERQVLRFILALYREARV